MKLPPAFKGLLLFLDRLLKTGLPVHAFHYSPACHKYMNLIKYLAYNKSTDSYL